MRRISSVRVVRVVERRDKRALRCVIWDWVWLEIVVRDEVEGFEMVVGRLGRVALR